MHQNTRGKVRFLGNLLFRRYSKFDGPIFGGGGQGKYIRGWGGYIRWGVNWVTYLWGVPSGEGVLTGFYSNLLDTNQTQGDIKCHIQHEES